MILPFTHDQFLEVFAAYNHLLWPAAILLWMATVSVLLRLYRHGLRESRLMAAMLSFHWMWAGAAYHLAFFSDINPAATAFGVVFLLQAALLMRRGVLRYGLNFGTSSPGWSRLGLGLVTYALVYPIIGVIVGLEYPRLPTFGVPCPTAILTTGTLLLVPRREARPLAVIPILWAGVGGSAAFLLDIKADIALLAGGVVLLVYVVSPGRRVPQSVA
jgi:hypothetical protein